MKRNLNIINFKLLIFFLTNISGGGAWAVSSLNVNWMLIDTSNSNLPDNNITDLTQSPDGAIWVSTYQGFAKYLGQNQWLTFHNPNVTFDDVCLAIKAQDSIIWVATVHGLVRYCNGNISVFDPSNSNLPHYILSLEVENNLLWIGTLDFGVFKYDGITFTNYSYANTGNMPLGNVDYIAVDQFGVKWFSCMDARPPGPNAHALVSYDNFSWTLFDTSNSGIKRYSYGVSIDSLNIKWITDIEGHVVKFDNISWTTFDSSNISYHPIFKSARVAFDHLGNKWVSTSKGFAKYDDSSWSFYDSSNSQYPSVMIYSRPIYVDDANNKLIGTNGKGLLIFNENGILLSTKELELNKKNIFFNGHFINEKFTAKIFTTKQMLCNVFILDISGQVINSVLKKNNSDRLYSISLEVDFSEFKNGVYFLVVQTLYESSAFKIIYVN